MDFRFVSLKWFGVVAVMALAFSTEGQQSTQPILFSSPDNGNGTDLNALSGDSKSDLQNALQSPSLFNHNQSGGKLPMPAIGGSPSEADGARLQKMLDDGKNWAFMTPEEILGVSTSGNSFQGSGHDTAGQDGNLSAVGRFTQRQNQADSANESSSSSLGWHDTDKENSAKLPPLVSPNLADSAPNWSLQDVIFNNNLFNDKKTLSGMAKMLGSSKGNVAPPPAFLSQQNQDVGMEQFRQLLAPPTVAALQSPSATLPNWSAKIQTPDDSTTPTLNNNINNNSGIGASFTPLSAGIAAPTGLTPLPRIVAQQYQQPQAPPSWAPKPAPWLSQEPQPFQMPQRKF